MFHPINFSLRNRLPWPELLLVFALLLGAGLRGVGLLNWDEGANNHPDELFLVSTTLNLEPVKSLGEYFNTQVSSLNPNNRGSGFYVYGTLPVFVVRYAAGWFHPGRGGVDWDTIKFTGRVFSALLDLGTVFLAYAIGRRLYGPKTGALAALLAGLTVLLIQQAHFYTTDNFANFFLYLAFYAAVCLAVPAGDVRRPPEGANWVGLSLLFGLAMGMALASKINVAPAVLLLPAAMFLRVLALIERDQKRANSLGNAPSGAVLFQRALHWALGGLVVGGLVCLLSFRIFQPYAFRGPAFLEVGLNPAWLENLSKLKLYSSRQVDYYPPAYQWARRPPWFGLQNMVVWGLGLPLGLAAWSGFLGAGAGILLGRLRRQPGWHRHLLLWTWTLGYFAWQAASFNPTLRYFIPIYPALAIFAAWGLVCLCARQAGAPRWRQGLAWGLSGLVVAGTLLWALAFVRIYTRPLTRVAASRWIYSHLPGPANLHIQGPAGEAHQPLPFPYDFLVQAGLPYTARFQAAASGALTDIFLPILVEPQTNYGEKEVSLKILPPAEVSQSPGASEARIDFTPLTGSEPEVHEAEFTFSPPFPVTAGSRYTLQATLPPGQTPVRFSGGFDLLFDSPAGSRLQLASFSDASFGALAPFPLVFTAPVEGVLTRVRLHINILPPAPHSGVLRVSVSAPQGSSSASLTLDLSSEKANPAGYRLVLDSPVSLVKGQEATWTLDWQGGGGPLAVQGTPLANEGQWDWGVPFSIDGYDGYGGIYPRGLDFNMYDEDTPAKLARFLRLLDGAEYLSISSNRQYGSLTRLPERFPLTERYYRLLLGCPPEARVFWCYSVARPGMFEGQLGYELIEVFQSNPGLGPWEINDQFAEEAFTVYDHPKVLIFRKTGDYDSKEVARLLGGIDFSNINHLLPGQAPGWLP